MSHLRCCSLNRLRAFSKTTAPSQDIPPRYKLAGRSTHRDCIEHGKLRLGGRPHGYRSTKAYRIVNAKTALDFTCHSIDLLDSKNQGRDSE